MDAHYYIGIDPGKHGAVAVLASDGRLVLLEDLPLTGTNKTPGRERRIDAVRLANLLKPFCPFALALLEKPRSYGMSGYANLSLGETYGICLGVLEACGAQCREQCAKDWKSACGLSDDKDLSVFLALELHPELPPAVRHDRAEAILIAEHLFESARNA